MSESNTNESTARPKVEFCYDFASPFSYLADCRIEQALADLAVELVRVPVYLRGFETFKKVPPLPAAKMAYLARDMLRTAEFYGIPMKAPISFPINGLYLLRGAIFLEGSPEQARFIVAGFRATWAEQREVSSAAAAADIAAEIGVDRDEFLAGIAAPPVKDTLRAHTEDAISRGAFGVPTFFVGEDMFWGQDRLDQVRHHIENLG